MNRPEPRYQFCQWYVKLWRRREYLKIPFDAIRTWLHNRRDTSFAESWSIAVGCAQVRMNWVWTLEECGGWE